MGWVVTMCFEAHPGLCPQTLMRNLLGQYDSSLSEFGGIFTGDIFRFTAGLSNKTHLKASYQTESPLFIHSGSLCLNPCFLLQIDHHNLTWQLLSTTTVWSAGHWAVPLEHLGLSATSSLSPSRFIIQVFKKRVKIFCICQPGTNRWVFPWVCTNCAYQYIIAPHTDNRKSTLCGKHNLTQ